MLRIRTLGGLSVEQEGRPAAAAAAQPRRLALLALVGRAGARGITRDKLLTLVWPDAEEESGRRSLNQALHALRRNLGEDGLFLGVQELRLNPEVAVCDVVEFEAALATGDLERAAAQYRGPFLDGFRLAGGPEFGRWADDERTALAHRYTTLLEQLARAAAAAGDTAAAVGWWRRLASADPLNGRVAAGLMHALLATGDRGGALHHARIYEVLVQQELELPPDREVLELARRIRAEQAAAPSKGKEPPAPEERPLASVPTGPKAEAVPSRPAEPPPGFAHPPARWRRLRLRWLALPVVVTVLGLAVAGLVTRSPRAAHEMPDRTAPVLAVGGIADYARDPGAAAAMADMLATNLARTPGVTVISPARLLALLERGSPQPALAARLAGAGVLVEGSLHRTPTGLRLDLRRVDVASGAVLGAWTVEGDDLFALADSGTMRLAADLGLAAPMGGVADLTTRSLTAFRLYSDGLREFYRGDPLVAARLFGAALADDSTFAMAAFYHALAPGITGDEQVRRLRRAVALADRATDAERLTILAAHARAVASPALGPLADTLAVRYPTAVEGHFYRGVARLRLGEWLAAAAAFQQVLALDSLGTEVPFLDCAACVTYGELVAAYLHADSVDAAVRAGLEGRRRFPQHPRTWQSAARALVHAGRYGEADAAFAESVRLGLNDGDLAVNQAWVRLMAEDYAAADRLLQRQLAQPSPDRERAQEYLALSLRAQGRLRESLAAAAALRNLAESRDGTGPRGSAHPAATLQALLLADLGRADEASALYDSISRWRLAGQDDAAVAENRIWALNHRASIAAAAGDTAGFAALVNEAAALASSAGTGPSRTMHHYIHGLLLARQGDPAGAEAAFLAAWNDPALGYTRLNMALGTLFLDHNRPRDAVAVLQPAARASIRGLNAFVTRPEARELLGRAWDAAAQPDSAILHYEQAIKAWSQADPEFAARRRSLEDRVRTLRRR